MNIQQSFGDLRTLINVAQWDDEHRHMLWQLVHNVHAHAPQEYRAQWLPYLQGFPHHFEQPFATWSKHKALEHAMEVLPMARWALNANYRVLSWEHLCGAVRSGSIMILKVCGYELPERRIKTLASAVRGHGLQALHLHNNELKLKGLRHLSDSDLFTGLTSLRLGSANTARCNRIGIEGAQVLAQCAALGALTDLRLYGNRVEDEGVRALVASPYITGLHSLNLGSNGIRESGAQALARAETLGGVQYLNLERNSIRDRGASAIARSKHLTGLTYLNLVTNNISRHGAVALADSSNLEGLTRFELGGNRIDDEGHHALLQSPYLPRYVAKTCLSS